MEYTVKQVCKLAGVSARTLHWYDEIGLLKPVTLGDNGYRQYDEESLLRLQQILFFRELGLGLKDIQAVLDQPGFNRLGALELHRTYLGREKERLERLIHTVDRTIAHLKGENEMSDESLFEGFDEETQERYAQEARERWGETANQSLKLWNSYPAEKKNQILQNGKEITLALRDAMPLGAAHPTVQALIERYHRHMGNFYECSYEILLALGNMYVEDERFRATFTKIDPAMPEFLQQAIQLYCKQKGKIGD